MLRDSTVAAAVRTRPRAIPLPVTTMRKSVHGFHFPYMVMGLPLVALWAAGTPLKSGLNALERFECRKTKTEVIILVNHEKHRQ